MRKAEDMKLKTYDEVISKIYHIPEKFLKEDAKYIVYGYASVGKSLCQFLQTDNRYKLVGAADRNADFYQNEICKVFHPYELKTIEFDYVIIAVENKKTADEIRSFLQSEGIKSERVLWDSNAYANREYLVNYCNNMHRFLEFNLKNNHVEKRKFYLFMLPEHGNLGDYAIGYSEMNFFKEFFPNNLLVCVTSSQWIHLKNEITQMVDERDVIFFNGGGYFGNLWRDDEYFKDIISYFPNNVKIFFPNNFTYKESISDENIDLMRGISWMQQQKNMYVFFRAKTSYDFAKKYYENVFYYPDMVLYSHFSRKFDASKKVLLCLRNDREKAFEGISKLKTIFLERDILFDEWDINLQKYISQSEGKEYVEQIVQKMQEYELIITDRLHGMILAVVGDVPVIAFDNSTHKVSDVYRWIKDIKTVSCLKNEDVEMVPDEMEKILQNKAGYSDYLREEFVKMAETIKMILGETKKNELRKFEQ